MSTDLNQQKILLQYSGGNNSTACLIYLKSKQLNFEVIHFVHLSSYEVPTNYVIKICSEFAIPYHIVDIISDLEKYSVDDFHLSPCQYCKSVMDKITLDYAQNNGFEIICTGDNISKYFNENVNLPEDIVIYRPLINLTVEEIKKIFGKIEIPNDSILKSVVNCRRLTRNGSVKNFIRSGAIETINEQDILLLKNIGVTVIVDFRKLQNPAVVNMICSQGIRYEKIFSESEVQKIFEKKYDGQTMVNSYMKFISQYKHMYKIFKIFSESEGTILFCCKYGRDRTGMVAIILELLADCSLEEILIDYLDSGLYFGYESISDRMIRKEICLNFIEEFTKKYTSAENYLQFIGLNKNQIDKLKIKIKADNQ